MSSSRDLEFSRRQTSTHPEAGPSRRRDSGVWALGPGPHPTSCTNCPGRSSTSFGHAPTWEGGESASPTWRQGRARRRGWTCRPLLGPRLTARTVVPVPQVAWPR